MRRPLLLAMAACLVTASSALADDEPAPKPAKPDAHEAPKGPQIAWRASWTEAAEESAERGLPIYVHSHGST